MILIRNIKKDYKYICLFLLFFVFNILFLYKLNINLKSTTYIIIDILIIILELVMFLYNVSCLVGILRYAII